MRREDRRQLMHVAAALPAIALVWMSPWTAVAFAAAGVVLGVVGFPLLGLDRRIRRDGEPRLSGIQLYPIGVFLVVLIFPLPIAAAGWAVLGVGDAASNVVGRRFGKRKLPWDDTKTWAGTIAFASFATPAAVGLLAWVAPNREASLLGLAWPTMIGDPSFGALLPAAVASAVAGAVVESIRGIDDNLTIPIAASLAAWIVLSVV